MITESMQIFRTVAELQRYLEREINFLKRESEELSKIAGDKLRCRESESSDELQELRQKIEGTSGDAKTKKSPKKKDKNSKWHDMESISIFDGIGIKGELEVYFKGIEEKKGLLNNLTKIKQEVDSLVDKGLKRDLGCIFLLNKDNRGEIAFTKTALERKKFVYKAIFNVPRDDESGVKIVQ